MSARSRAPRLALSLAALLVAAAAPATAGATAPGQDGVIALAAGGDIWTVAPDGTGLHRVTEGPDLDAQPAWSADGRWLLFTRESAGRTDVWRLPAPGGPPQRVTDTAVAERRPSPSPDGTRMLFSRPGAGGTSDLYVADADGTRARLLTRNADDARWSPDGTRIVLATGGDGGDVEVMDADGTHRTPLAGVNGASPMSVERAPDWSPDGAGVLVGRWESDDATGTAWSDLVVAGAGGDAVRTLRRDETGDSLWTGVFAPSGTRVAYLQGPSSRLMVMPTAGGPGVALTPEGLDVRDLAWQPLPVAPPPPAAAGTGGDAATPTAVTTVAALPQSTVVSGGPTRHPARIVSAAVRRVPGSAAVTLRVRLSRPVVRRLLEVRARGRLVRRVPVSGAAVRVRLATGPAALRVRLVGAPGPARLVRVPA